MKSSFLLQSFIWGLLGVLLGVLGRLGLILGFNIASRWASWVHLGLQYRLKMAQVALHRATKFARRVSWGGSWALLKRFGASWAYLGHQYRLKMAQEAIPRVSKLAQRMS